jgi:ATP-dependent Zn protease
VLVAAEGTWTAALAAPRAVTSPVGQQGEGGWLEDADRPDDPVAASMRAAAAAPGSQLEALDPALTRPGRMGRYVWLRTPTKKDRLDIFDLYLKKVSHDPDLDSETRRDEIARITNGYSPAMIEQVCSMALTYAHHEGKPRFGWEEIVEAMTTIESGMAINIEYIPEESRAVAIHEAGHAAAGHVGRYGAR